MKTNYKWLNMTNMTKLLKEFDKWLHELAKKNGITQY
mgnify:CR=1 FL=1